MPTPLPDAAMLVNQYLRTVPEVTAICGERIFPSFPRQVPLSASFVIIQRIGGLPPLPRPLVVDLAALQLDAYGPQSTSPAKGQAEAHELVATCRAFLAGLQGEMPNAAGNVCGVIVGPLRYVPDETYKPPRPRYVSDFEVTVKPAGAAIAGRV